MKFRKRKYIKNVKIVLQLQKPWKNNSSRVSSTWLFSMSERERKTSSSHKPPLCFHHLMIKEREGEEGVQYWTRASGKGLGVLDPTERKAWDSSLTHILVRAAMRDQVKDPNWPASCFLQCPTRCLWNIHKQKMKADLSCTIAIGTRILKLSPVRFIEWFLVPVLRKLIQGGEEFSGFKATLKEVAFCCHKCICSTTTVCSTPARQFRAIDGTGQQLCTPTTKESNSHQPRKIGRGVVCGWEGEDVGSLEWWGQGVPERGWKTTCSGKTQWQNYLLDLITHFPTCCNSFLSLDLCQLYWCHRSEESHRQPEGLSRGM